MTQAYGVSWSTTKGPTGREIRVEPTGHFDARGMVRLYGRGDGWAGHRSFNMDVWYGKGGRVLARFCARSDDVDWASYEIFGLTPVFPNTGSGQERYSELNVPELLRREYDNWITTNY